MRLDKDKSLEVVEEERKTNHLEKEKFIPALSLASELGFSISLPIVGGAFLGQFLDNKFNSSPRITLSLVFLGVFLAILFAIIILKSIERKRTIFFFTFIGGAFFLIFSNCNFNSFISSLDSFENEIILFLLSVTMTMNLVYISSANIREDDG